MIPYLSKNFNEILLDLYEITNGKIIIGGSLSLRMQNVINRDISDIDINLTKTDWDIFESTISKKYKIYNGPLMKIPPHLEYRINKVLTKNNLNEFHLFINFIEDNLYNNLVYNDKKFRLFKPELHLLDKEFMLMDDSYNLKHILDIQNIKRFINEK